MRRLRFFKVLLPVVLALVLVALVWAVRPRQQGPGLPPMGDTAEGVTDVEAIDKGPDGQAIQMRAMEIRRNQDDSISIIGGTWAQVWREGADPLEVMSEHGDIRGETGRRTMRFEKGVTFIDPVKELEIVLPELDIDEAEGVARADAPVRFHGPDVRGRAAGMTYYLDTDKPAELRSPNFETTDGARLSAELGWLHDGLDDVELSGDVRGSRGTERFVAGRLRLYRDEANRIRRIVTGNGFTGYVTTADRTEARAAGLGAEIRWDSEGLVESFELTDGAELSRGADGIEAISIGATRPAGSQGDWRVEARGNVLARGHIGGGDGWLRADALDAWLGPGQTLRQAEALGHVRFEGQGTRAEADRASFEMTLGGGDIRLFATGMRKALLERDRARVAGRQIQTDPRGENMVARGQVEATLLPPADPETGSPQADSLAGLFAADEAVHFVSETLTGRSAGAEWVFEGAVRGWQGERNLSADRVELDQRQSILVAVGSVNTRVPREEGGASSADDYVHIAAARLRYADSERLAVYREEVRVRMSEGWLESALVEVRLAESGGIAEIRASESVQLEFRDARQSPPRIVTGTADRMLYVPEKSTVWLYGDNTPATVRRLGEDGGVTRGRVLRYQLDEGTLDVESGGVSAPGS